jgi:predicted GNAT superfamily acetyltransferase
MLKPNQMNDQIGIRPLESAEDFHRFEALQRETWGQDLAEVVTVSLAKIVRKIGGIAAGAFDERGTMLGFVFGFTGFTGGRPVHWSHMLAVKKEFRDAGIGRKLKLYQRETLLAAGVEEVFWTYDPLVSRNAHLNFVSLGVEATQYVTDMYGPGEDSELFRGLGTDRLIVVWHIAGVRVKDALVRQFPIDPAPFSTSPIVVCRQNEVDEFSPPREVHFARENKLRIEIPKNIHTLRERSAEGAAQWRLMTREAFQFYLKGGYEIFTFYCDDATGRRFYCLSEKA